MVSARRYSEISESTSRILNPLSESKLLQLGRLCRLGPGQRLLDLACGKGELVCRFARRHGTAGLGIDISPLFVAAARARAVELGVEALVDFREGDATAPGGIIDAATTLGPGAPRTGGVADDGARRFDLVSCIGATWIGGGLDGTLGLMGTWARPGAWLVVGEVYWAEEPPASVRRGQETHQGFADLAGTLDRFEAAGFELVEMLLATADEWDRYQSAQWLAASDWVAAHPEDPDADEVARRTDRWRRAYLTDLRRCMGWGAFVLRERG